MKTTFIIQGPQGFDFGLTARSHGWYDLAPFILDAESTSLSYVLRDSAGRVARVSMSPVEGGVSCRVESRDLKNSRGFVKGRVAHILRFDEELSDFYRLVSQDSSLRWVKRRGAGRLLRSATVFEDLVKTICTTNCSWALTKVMVANLVAHLGEGDEVFGRAFPTAEAMAEMNEGFYRDVVRAGYRAPYFMQLARQVARRELDPEAWLDPGIPISELKKQIKSVKGVGDYAAENLLKLLGRYDGLALDSWLRAGFYSKHNGGKKCADAKIQRFYEKFGKWKGLAIWCDMTEEWH